jgi:hypothetical protein
VGGELEVKRSGPSKKEGGALEGRGMKGLEPMEAREGGVKAFCGGQSEKGGVEVEGGSEVAIEEEARWTVGKKVVAIAEHGAKEDRQAKGDRLEDGIRATLVERRVPKHVVASIDEFHLMVGNVPKEMDAFEAAKGLIHLLGVGFVGTRPKNGEPDWKAVGAKCAREFDRVEHILHRTQTRNEEGADRAVRGAERPHLGRARDGTRDRDEGNLALERSFEGGEGPSKNRNSVKGRQDCQALGEA